MQRDDMDYKDLLRRYIAHIGKETCSDWLNWMPLNMTEEEYEAILELR